MHVWTQDLDVDEVTLQRRADDLSPSELARASQLAFATDKRRFVVAHAFLRSVLGSYLDCPPSAVPITADARGKPELGLGGSDVRFNLAHSGELAACAVAFGSPVGIDVERIGDTRDVAGLAQKVLSKRELLHLRAIGGITEERFLTAWTLKEAFLKARGEGLARDPSEIEVSFDARGGSAQLLAVANEPGAEHKWCLTTLQLHDGYVAAVAVEGECTVRRLSCVLNPFGHPY